MYKLKKESESRSVMSDSLQLWNSPDQNTGVGSIFLLQGIFPTQGLNPFFTTRETHLTLFLRNLKI